MLFHIAKPPKDKNENPRISKAWELKREKSQFNHARKGDHLLVPFECNLCVFRNLRKVSLDFSLHADILLLSCIRGVNFDDF